MKDLKLKILFFAIMLFLMLLIATSCNTTSGNKVGLLQSAKEESYFTCVDKHYIAEIAYVGGRAVEGGTENSQKFEISKVLYDSMQYYVGSTIVFDYIEVPRGFSCALEHEITSFRLK